MARTSYHFPSNGLRLPKAFLILLATFCMTTTAGPAAPEGFTDSFEDGVLEASWALTGVGNANQSAVDEAGGVLALTADGATAFSGADNAGFLNREAVGDFRAEVAIDGSTMSTGGAFRKAGLMVRESIDPWSRRLLALVSAVLERQSRQPPAIRRPPRHGWSRQLSRG